jgi:stage II sporulation protein D
LRKIGFFIILIIFLMFVIPIAVVGGVGSGIKIPGVINKIVEQIPVPSKEGKIEENKEDYKIKVYVVSEKKVREMPLEDYIRGVVAAEMPVAFESEALKAQAVAARTYAAARMRQFGGNGCEKHPNAPEHDACSDVHCQAWISKADRFKNWDQKDVEANWSKLTKAVEETKGMIMSYKGELVRNAMYHSTSGGKTESSLEVFGYNHPYLVSVSSPNEEVSPSFESKAVFKNAEFVSRMKQLNSKIKLDTKKLSSQIRIVEKTDGDRVKSIKIGDKTFTGIDIRWAFNLKSANFSVKADSKYVTFIVRGNGHGVGMSQWGAGEMARRGKKYDEVLKHYYTGIEVSKIEQIFKPATK